MRYPNLFVTSLGIFFLCAFAVDAKSYEGFGAVTQGADECASTSVFRVTSLEDSGPGTLREGLSQQCRIIMFDVSGTIFVKSTLKVRSFTTIDGSSAPESSDAYGITLRKYNNDKDIALMELVRINDVVINNLRFIGEGYDNGADNLSLIGCNRVVIDHVSSGYGDDGAIDISWGWDLDAGWANRNITVSWSILHNTIKAMLIKYGPHHNISLHHNLFAKNQERNPQLRNQIETIDFVNNIIFEWGLPGGWGYGLRLATHDPEENLSGSLIFGGDGYVDANIVGNLFLAGQSPTPNLGIQTLKVSGGNGDLGDVYFHDNVVPAEDSIPSSTITAPLPIVADAKVTTHTSSELPGILLSQVGPKYRTPEETAIVNEVLANLGQRPKPPILLDE